MSIKLYKKFPWQPPVRQRPQVQLQALVNIVFTNRTKFFYLSYFYLKLKVCYLGCYQDQYTPDLNGPSYTSSNAMTIEKCRSFCSNYLYAGLQNG